MKNRKVLALALVGVLSLSALAPAALAATDTETAGSETVIEETQKERRRGRHGEGERVAEPENAIGKDAAKSKALADAGVTAEQAGEVKSRVSQLDDGTVVYKVRFTCDGQRYSYQINALTGEVTDKSAEAVTGEESTAHHRRGGRGEGKQVAEPENAIGKDAAKSKALADAGVTAEQAGKVKSHVSQTEDGTVIYKVRFTCDGQRYSYQINALTGEVTDKSAEAVTEEESTAHHRRGGRGKGGKPVGQTEQTAPATA